MLQNLKKIKKSCKSISSKHTLLQVYTQKISTFCRFVVFLLSYVIMIYTNTVSSNHFFSDILAF